MNSPWKVLIGLVALIFVIIGFSLLHTDPAVTTPEPTPTPTPTTTPIATTTVTTTTSPVLTGQLNGRVTLSPICPVETVPPAAACAPKGYQTTVIALVAGTQKEVGRTTSGADGKFLLAFLPGRYDIEAVGGATLPRCEVKTVTLVKNATTTVDLSCDTGIR